MSMVVARRHMTRKKAAQTERGLPEGNSDGRHWACRWLSRGAIRHASERLRRIESCRRVIQMGGIGHVGGCREALYDTRVSGSDGARAAGG
jgi:hypothetical protein